jgi:hypothetical protein
MVLHDAGGVLRGKLNNVRAGVKKMIQGSCKRGVEQGFVTHALSASMLSKLPIVDREHQFVLDPDRLAHFASSRSVFR